jgi:hypothetical protein
MLGSLLLIAPLIDEIVGAIQFSYYCDEQSTTILDSISVSSEFYTNTGKWRLEDWPKLSSKEYGEYVELVRKADSYVHWDSNNYIPMQGFLLIEKRPTKIYSKESGKLLAQWNSYAYRGGMLRKSLSWYTNECHPPNNGYSLYKKIFYQTKETVASENT